MESVVLIVPFFFSFHFSIFDLFFFSRKYSIFFLSVLGFFVWFQFHAVAKGTE